MASAIYKQKEISRIRNLFSGKYFFISRHHSTTQSTNYLPGNNSGNNLLTLPLGQALHLVQRFESYFILMRKKE